MEPVRRGRSLRFWLPIVVAGELACGGAETTPVPPGDDTGTPSTTSGVTPPSAETTTGGGTTGSGTGTSDGTDGGDETSTASTGAPVDDCQLDRIAAPPEALVTEWGLSSFYEQHLDVGGLPILGSANVQPEAFVVACEIVRQMLAMRPDVHTQLIDNQIRVGIMAVDEVTTDIPEHADLYDVFPGIDWDNRARGLGATIERPASTVGEENLLHLPVDEYAGESIMVHEFAHTVWNVGVQHLPDGAARQQELVAAYTDALGAGLWAQTYAATDDREYWAEAVQSWFNTNREADPPDGVHNHVNTREELSAYDPTVAAIVAQVFFDDDWVVP